MSGPLEASAFAFASDLADEGVDAALGNLHYRAGLDGVTPAFVYHAARDVFPHNPKRKVHLLDRGAHFFPPDWGLYDGLRIQPSVHPTARERDVLEETCREAGRRGMRVHAWTVFLHVDRPGEHVECTTRNVFGDHYAADLCPANPDVRSYVRALVADVARYEVETILAESLHYHGLEHGYHHERYFIELGPWVHYLLGLCFCESCLDRARRQGVAVDAVRSAVRGEIEHAFAERHVSVDDDVESLAGALAGGELAGYLDARAETVTTLVAEAAEVAAASGRRLVFLELAGAVKGYASGRPVGAPAAESSWRLGVDLAGIARVCPEIEVLGYAADVERVRLDLAKYRDHVGAAALSVALRPSPPDCETPENLAAKVELAREEGVRRVDFYHYGFVRLEALDWMRAALDT